MNLPLLRTSPDRSPAANFGLWLAGAFAVGVVVLAIQTGQRDTSDAVEAAPVEVTGTWLADVPAPGQWDPAWGAPAPVGYGVDFDAQPARVPAHGQDTLVVFLAHWCPYCQEEVPVLVAAGEQGLLDDVAVVAVVTATNRGQPNWPPSAWLAREGWPHPVIVDSEGGQLASAFGVNGFPAFVAVDADGTVLARTIGALGEAPLRALLGVFD